MREIAKLRVEVYPSDKTLPDELFEQIIALRKDLLELGVEGASLAREAGSTLGMKSGDTFSYGQMLITAVPSSSLLGAVVAVIVRRLANPITRSARIEAQGEVLELTGLDSRHQQELIHYWIAKQNKTTE